jgi:hypothetical protein
MSTTFGVITKSGEEIPVARRVGTSIFFTNELAEMLHDEIKVVPLDNTEQGIYTIGDIRKAIKEELWKRKKV